MSTLPALQETARNTCCFSDSNFTRMRSMMTEMKMPAGSHLFWEGDAADKFYYIYGGSVKLSKSSVEGKELIVYMYTGGDIVGQADPIGSCTHSYTAEVLEDSVIGVIDQRDMEFLICQDGSFAMDFMKWMGNHHRLTQTKFRDLMMYGKPGALCSTLIRLGNMYGEHTGGRIIIHKKLTNTDLSNLIGATRESVNRMLGDLRKSGAVDIEDGLLVINDLSHLEGICHCEHCPKEICRI